MERVLPAILLDRIGLYQYIFGFALIVAHKTSRALSNVANRRCFRIRSRIQSCNLGYSWPRSSRIFWVFFHQVFDFTLQSLNFLLLSILCHLVRTLDDLGLISFKPLKLLFQVTDLKLMVIATFCLRYSINHNRLGLQWLYRLFSALRWGFVFLLLFSDCMK